MDIFPLDLHMAGAFPAGFDVVVLSSAAGTCPPFGSVHSNLAEVLQV